MFSQVPSVLAVFPGARASLARGLPGPDVGARNHQDNRGVSGVSWTGGTPMAGWFINVYKGKSH